MTVKPRRPEDTYGGSALVFIRDVLDVTGPQLPSCLAFIERYRDRLTPIPQVGQVVLYDNKPYGNIGLYVGKDAVLMMDPSGYPTLRPLMHPYGRDDDPSPFCGAMWWPKVWD